MQSFTNFFRKKQKVEQKTTIKLNHIFTDQKGNKYYEYANNTDMPIHRQQEAVKALRYFDLNLTSSQLTQICSDGIAAINSGKLVEAGAKFQEIIQRQQYLGEVTTTLNLACVYFLIEGENPETYDQVFQMKKMKLWSEDAKAKSFFLRKVYQYINLSSELSETDFLTYLQDREEEIPMNTPAKKQDKKKTTPKKSSFYKRPILEKGLMKKGSSSPNKIPKSPKK